MHAAWRERGPEVIDRLTRGLEGYDVMRLERAVAALKRDVAALRREVEANRPHKVVAIKMRESDGD